MNGQSISEVNNESGGIVVVGNESKGISDESLDVIDHKVTIPRFGGAESLNAAVACGIACHCLVGQF